MRQRVAVTRPAGPPHGSIPHDSSTNLSCQIARLNADSPIHNCAHLLTSYPRSINYFYSWKRLNPIFKENKTNMTELIVYIFGKGKSSPKVRRHQKKKKKKKKKNSSDVIKVLSSYKPKTSGKVGFFSKNSFQINKICVEPKYTLQVIALFLNWKQPLYGLKMS